jgi:hypothetical protein
MNDETLLERYIGGRDARAGVNEQAEADCADCRAFGWLRGVRDFARMLELRRRDGNIVAVDYARLERAEFNPSEGITLTVGGQTIRIRGRNLNAEVRPSVRLFEGITRHRVSFIREADRSAGLRAGERETVVDAIEW